MDAYARALQKVKNMQVKINYDIEVAPTIEEQLNFQGATLCEKADQIQNALTYCELLYIWGYLSESESVKCNERIKKDVQKSVKLCSERSEIDAREI